jgi:hypothetical protein
MKIGISHDEELTNFSTRSIVWTYGTISCIPDAHLAPTGKPSAQIHENLEPAP